MTANAGRTAAEIREFVHEYQVQPHGGKRAWLAGQDVSYGQLRRWRSAVYEGDLERGLVPREGVGMTTSSAKRTALERQRAAERAEHEAELARLTARVAELEGVNEALGKAIGLLHAMNEHEPDATQTTTDPSDS